MNEVSTEDGCLLNITGGHDSIRIEVHDSACQGVRYVILDVGTDSGTGVVNLRYYDVSGFRTSALDEDMRLLVAAATRVFTWAEQNGVDTSNLAKQFHALRRLVVGGISISGGAAELEW